MNLSRGSSFADIRTTCSEPGFLLILALIAATLVVSVLARHLGYFGYDEAIYHLMVRAFETGGRLHLWNGYQEFPTHELVPRHVRVHDGKLAAQYPYLFGLIAAPFYRLLGFGGLIVANALAYCGTVLLTVALAHRIFRDRNVAVVSGLALILSTFSWQYAFAAWPHALTMLCVTASIYLAVLALDEQDTRRSVTMAFASGLVAGLATGFRLDSIFLFSSIGIPFLISRPIRLAQAIAVFLGALPGLAALAYTNHLKFGVATPFSYGPGLKLTSADAQSYLPLVLAIALFLLGVLAYKYFRNSQVFSNVRRRTILIFLGFGAVAFVWLAWPWLIKFAQGFYALVIDLRIRDLGLEKPGLSRGPGGSLVYAGGVQKSFLQSCPYLVVLWIPVVYLLRRGADPARLSVLVLAPLTYIAAFSYREWAGGLMLHVRYFVSVLPLIAILAAWVWCKIARESRFDRKHILVGSCVMVLAVAMVVGSVISGPVDRAHEFVLLTVPLVLAAVLLGLSLLWMFTEQLRKTSWRLPSGVFAACLLFAFAWSGVVTFLYDIPRDLEIRAIRAEIRENISPLVSSDSLVLGLPHHNIMGLFSTERVRLARPDPATLRDTRPLVAFHRQAGRPVYLWVEPYFVDGDIDQAISRIENAFAPAKFRMLYRGRYGRLFRLVPGSS